MLWPVFCYGEFRGTFAFQTFWVYFSFPFWKCIKVTLNSLWWNGCCFPLSVFMSDGRYGGIATTDNVRIWRALWWSRGPSIWWWIWVHGSYHHCSILQLSWAFAHRTGDITILCQSLNRQTGKRTGHFLQTFFLVLTEKKAFEGKVGCGVYWGAWAHFLVLAVLCRELMVITLQNGKRMLWAVLRT